MEGSLFKFKFLHALLTVPSSKRVNDLLKGHPEDTLVVGTAIKWHNLII